MVRNKLLLILLSALAMFACSESKQSGDDVANLTWPQIEQQAKGKSVTMLMYVGSKSLNKYINEYVIPTLKQRYNIDMNVVNGQGKDIVNNIMSEKEAGKSVGQADLCWINGETFYQLRQIDGLYGPYTSQLPNSKYVDYNNPIIRYDFQEEVKGYETPWSLATFFLMYDSVRVQTPPKSMQDFEQYWQSNLGKFTLPNDFSGYTLLKTWLIEIAGGGNALDGAYNEEKYEKYSKQLWQFINKNKHNFWKKGETFPATNTAVSQMFGSGELNFGISFGLSEIDLKVNEGVLPKSTKPLILKAGAIQNTNYIGITYNSSQKAAAMVVCNFLISPEAQAKKADLTYSGARPVLDYKKLSKEDQKMFDKLTKIKYGLQPADLEGKTIKEPAPTYMIKIADDFRKYVIEAN